MIINQYGATFEYEGVTYTIGAPIVGTAESEYEGLYGTITEIRDGDDKDTENETPDLYCEFEPPVQPCEIKELEQVFSDLYDEPKTLDDIILDLVIMAPSMIRPLDQSQAQQEEIPIFIVMEDLAVDGEHGDSCELFIEYDDAKRCMDAKLREEMEMGIVPQWLGAGGIENSFKGSYEAYVDGEYVMNHYSISIQKRAIHVGRKKHEL